MGAAIVMNDPKEAMDRIDEDFARIKRHRLITLDLDAMDENPGRGAFEDCVQSLVASAVVYGAGDRYRRLWKGIVAEAARRFPARIEDPTRRRVSISPDTDQMARRCTRVFAMVHELHKAGFQRIWMIPHMSPSGMHWRCAVTFRGNVEPNGHTTKSEYFDDARVAHYSSADGASYFGIKGSETFDARALAVAFLARFPMIAEQGRGIDWTYAGWVTDVLGQAEQGGQGNIVRLYADYDLAPDYLRRWRPPSPL